MDDDKKKRARAALAQTREKLLEAIGQMSELEEMIDAAEAAHVEDPLSEKSATLAVEVHEKFDLIMSLMPKKH
jgi:thymidine phosphorylase